MNSFGIFFEVFLSIHALLTLSSLCVGQHWLIQLPSLKLRLARLVFASCIFSPIAVHFLKQPDEPLLTKFVSTDAFHGTENTPVLDGKKWKPEFMQSLHTNDVKIMNYWQLIFILFFLGILYQGYSFVKDLRKLKYILRASTHYRSHRKLFVSVSDRCSVPFAVRLFGKAYIVLPISLLSSSTDVKIALAHEGQHHRQGDCLWAYFIEGARILFWGNPGVRRWHRILNELQELTCDEALVGRKTVSAHDYAHCLFKVAQTASQYSDAHDRKFACTVGLARNDGDHKRSFITRRICMLSQYQLNTPRHSLFGFVFAISAIMGPLCTAYATMGSLSPATHSAIDTSSLDPRIQQIAANEIRAAVIRYHAKSGAIAVANPSTGKIIAFAESGSVKDSESWSSRLFAPGSTLKPFVAAAAIDAGVASESQIYNCREPYDVDGTRFMNGDHRIGNLSVTEAMVKSVNICMIKVAQDLGPVKFRQTLAEFGFDTNSQWHTDKSDALQLATATLGTTNTIPVTMKAMTEAYAILANKGHLFPENSGVAVSEAAADSVTRMLVQAVERGTGTRAGISDTHVAGKTGTLVTDNNLSQGDLALFAGYVPAEAPRLVAFVVIEDGHNGRKDKETSGGALAAPVFHNVASKSLKVLSK